VRLLAERHIDVSARTVLNWVQTFGPQLAVALRRHRRRFGQSRGEEIGPPAAEKKPRHSLAEAVW